MSPDVTVKTRPGPRRLEAGMILLDPNGGQPRLWTVTRTTTRSVELASPDGTLEAALKGTTTPATDWRILHAGTILDALTAAGDLDDLLPAPAFAQRDDEPARPAAAPILGTVEERPDDAHVGVNANDPA